MTLSEYVRRRNGVPMGSNRSLRNNLSRALGANNFAVFWNYWNPIFGYYLGLKVFKPLKSFLPASLSLLITFVFCGMIHDVVTTVIRGDISWFFSLWFLFMGCLVMLAKNLNYNLSNHNWVVRAIVNVFCVAICFGLAFSIYQSIY